jgi:hypothetical protein
VVLVAAHRGWQAGQGRRVGEGRRAVEGQPEEVAGRLVVLVVQEQMVDQGQMAVQARPVAVAPLEEEEGHWVARGLVHQEG